MLPQEAGYDFVFGFAQFGELCRHASNGAMVLADLQAGAGGCDGGSVSVAAEGVDKRMRNVFNVMIMVVYSSNDRSCAFAGERHDGGVAPGFPDCFQRLRSEGIVVVAEHRLTGNGQSECFRWSAATTTSFFPWYQFRISVVDKIVEVTADTSS